MENFKVLLTCTNFHASGIVRSLKENGECSVDVYCVNSCASELPAEELCAGRFVAPKVNTPDYIPFLVEICEEHGIDIVMPLSNLDLEIIAEHREDFERIGVKVSACDIEKLRIANNKIALSRLYPYWMPRQLLTESFDDVENFQAEVGSVCCKLANRSGGKGFAVVDDVKASNPDLFHRFGMKHYITNDILKTCIKDNADGLVIQEYIDGTDYTVSCLCDNGRVTHICGYKGNVLDFGAIMQGEVFFNDQAYQIAKTIVSDMELDGNIAFDFILTPDKAYLLEINPRVNASLAFVAKAGCNMAYLRCKQLLGHDISQSGKEIHYGLKMKKHFETRYYI